MKYTQKGFLHYILILAAIIIGIQLGYFTVIGTASSHWLLASIFLFLIFVILSSYQISIELTDTALIFKAGIGIMSKSIPYNQIAHGSVESTKWWNGIGIRYIGKGWLYNIKFGKTLEIHYKNKTTVTQFGFDQAEEISKELNKRLTLVN